ncbi:MAG: 4Fe-4S dicluster domain-containing protein, partial [Candidatus Lokiarchaeota archaeon]|nr:4Fe-4S dicluster domain-containing protein [Candidatus Lokiarchaeota archaeon]MBD3200483.1 4Fe-4S dicluster domain-containing protein [Candidatus Lokiarchaeota archaeon]
EIIRTGICTECGTCAAVCPVLEWDHMSGQPKLVGKCTGCGICYNQCPRTITDPDQLMGEFKTGYVANNDIPEVVGVQDGGAVTSLLCYLFDEHLIDAAVVTMKDPNKPWYPMAQIITSKEDAINSSGSIYCHSQTVEALMEAIRQDYRSIAFVGTPCNIDAVNKMYNSPTGMLKYFMRANILTIGLFCMDSFAPEALYPFFEKDGIDLSKVKKMDINRGKFHVYYDEDGEPVKSYTIKQLDKFKSSSCNFCTDLTAENADISVGSVGSGAGKNTVFSRTGIGTEIIQDAAKKGYLTIEPFDAINLNSVLFLAKLKKVSQYNIQKRKVFIVRDTSDEEEARIETKREEKKLDIKPILDSRRALSVKRNVNEEEKVLELSITNTIGFILENLKIRIAAVDDVFEKNVWVTSIKELFPYEAIEINYPLEEGGELQLGKVLIEAISDDYGKIYSKSYNLAPKK